MEPNWNQILELGLNGTKLEPNLTRGVTHADRKIASLKPGKELVELWDESTPGFGIRVSSKGKKTWFVMYRFAGLRRRLKFGQYPEISLEKAGQKAKKALSDVSDGKDPAQGKKAQEALIKRERLEAKTFAQLAQLYIEEYAKLNKRSWAEDERIIEKLLKPEFGTLNVKEITRSHVRGFLRAMAAKTKVQANRAQDRVYNKYNYLKEKQEALNVWGARLARIVSSLELVKAENSEA